MLARLAAGLAAVLATAFVAALVGVADDRLAARLAGAGDSGTGSGDGASATFLAARDRRFGAASATSTSAAGVGSVGGDGVRRRARLATSPGVGGRGLDRCRNGRLPGSDLAGRDEGGVDAPAFRHVAHDDHGDRLADRHRGACAARHRIAHQPQREVHQHISGPGVSAVRGVALDDHRATGADRVAFDEVEEREQVVDRSLGRR